MLAITVDSRFPFAVSPECCSCPCFSNGVVSLTLRKRSHRKIVSHSAGHSIFNRQNKKPIHYTAKKQKDFPLSDFAILCNGFEIQRRDCLFICSLADSTKKHRVQTAVFSLSIPQALGGLHRILNRNILYLVVTSFIGTLLYQTPRRKSSLW